MIVIVIVIVIVLDCVYAWVHNEHVVSVVCGRAVKGGTASGVRRTRTNSNPDRTGPDRT